jgi:DNA-binding CsgD family transcriptional regulator
LLDASRLLFDLQQANEIAQRFSGCPEPEAIARYTTDGLVERFNSAFARIWLLEPDQVTLRLVASSGLYTRIDGSFARVQMGSYKVGKIAQNRVAFLSNNLAEETWVKDRDWALANQIRGFAGFPLMVDDRVIGVLATFSHAALAPEFLEVLQVLCITAAVTLETALRYRQQPSLKAAQPTLSDQIAAMLKPARLTLIGTEQPLSLAQTHLCLQVSEILGRLGCRHGRLIYGSDAVSLEAAVTQTTPQTTDPATPSAESLNNWLQSRFGMLPLTAAGLSGELQCLSTNSKTVQILLKLPYAPATGPMLQICCSASVLQLAFTHLAYAAGLGVIATPTAGAVLLTDDLSQIRAGQPVIWVQQGAIPKGVNASVDLSVTPADLRQAVIAASRGELLLPVDEPPTEREREILALLSQGLRDRDIAAQLVISESTVKFHVNNLLSKFRARTRFQALYQALKQGWL